MEPPITYNEVIGVLKNWNNTEKPFVPSNFLTNDPSREEFVALVARGIMYQAIVIMLREAYPPEKFLTIAAAVAKVTENEVWHVLVEKKQ